MKILLWLLVALTFAGCAHRGFHRGEIRKALSYPVLTDDAAIARTLDLKPQLTAPFRLGVFFHERNVKSWFNPRWRWTIRDANSIERALQPFLDSGVIKEIVMIDAFMADGTDLKSVRSAAARYGVDAVLAINGIADWDTHANAWSMFYLTIIGGWLAPGTETIAYFAMYGSLWDVRNSYLYASASAESIKQDAVPGFQVDRTGVITKAKDDALRKFELELERKFEALYQH